MMISRFRYFNRQIATNMTRGTSHLARAPHAKRQAAPLDRYVLLAWVRIVIFVIGMLIAMGCERVDGPTPPTIVFGEQECDVCSMIISDDRFAAGLVVEEGEAAYVPVVFDDIGCMLAYGRSESDVKVAARYVRDFSTRQWLDAEAAVYVHSPTLETPMAFGVAAFADRGGALAMQDEHGGAGDVCDVTEIERRFDAGLLASDPFSD